QEWGYLIGQHGRHGLIGAGQHPASQYNPARRGWIAIATYSRYGPADFWAANQIYLLEITEDRPRIVRLSPTFTDYWKGDKTASYYGESFASFNPAGDRIYWGTNWLGQDNLELYRLELPEDWD